MNDFKKIILSASSKFSYQILSILIVFFLTPLMIKTLGNYKYGIWVLVNIFAGYYAYTDLGLSSAIERNMAVAIGKKNDSEFKNIFVNGVFLNLICFIAVIIISLLSFYIINLLNIKGHSLISTLILIMGLNLAFTFPFRCFYSIISANIRFDIISGINIFQLISNSLATVYLLLNGYGLIALALANLCTTVISNLAYLYFAPKLSNLICFDFKFINKKEIQKLFNYSSKTVLVQVAEILKFKLDEIITASCVSINMVTTYSIPNKLNSNANSFGSNFLTILHPLFSKNMKIKSDEEKIKLFYFTSKIMITISCLFFFGFLFLGKQFINLWVGTDYSVAYYVLLILSFFSFIAFIQGIGAQYLFSANKHQYFAFIAILEGVLNLLFSLIYVIYFKLGVIGVALGTLTPALYTKLVLQPNYICKVLKLKLKSYYLFLLKNVIIGGLMYLPMGLFAFSFNINNYLKFFGFVFAFLILSLAHFIFIANKQEKAILVKKLLMEFEIIKNKEVNYENSQTRTY